MLTKYDAYGNPITAAAAPASFSQEVAVSTGSAYTVTSALITANTAILLVFDSASGAAKTVTLPAATGSGKRILVVDGYGDAATNNISFTGASIVGAQKIYTNFGQLWLTDSATLGWVSGI